MNEVPQQPTGQPGQWWIRVPAGQFGPVDLETVRLWVQQGRITPNDSIYNPDTKAWLPAPSVPQLTGLFPPQAPAAPHGPAPPPVTPPPYLGQIPQPEKKGANVGCIIAALVALLIAVPFVAGFLLPAFARAREQARRASCLNNIKQLGLAMKQYVQDYRDVYPWREGAADADEAWCDLGLLYPNYMSAPNIFFCPSSDDRIFEPQGADGRYLRNHPFGTLAGDNPREVISYGYCYARTRQGPKAWTEGARKTVRLLADKKAGIQITEDVLRLSAHRDDGRNILYHDGHVKWKPGPDPLDPDEDSRLIGKPDAIDYTDWWSDPPWYGEGEER